METSLKRKLYSFCEAYVAEKIQLAQQSMDEAQQAANEETKSSVGDKYETGRAMMQMEREKYARQLAEALELQAALSQIDIKKTYAIVQLGCLVETNEGSFFIAISAGKTALEGEEYFAISLASPIGKLLHRLSVGETASFRGRDFKILAIG